MEGVGERLPPGQKETRGWPILHAGSVPPLHKGNWTLEVSGEGVENPLSINYDTFFELPQTRVGCDIHCVTSWSKFGMNWEGVRFLDLMDRARPNDKARYVVMECEEGWTTSLPMEDLMREDVLLAYRVDGQDLTTAHGGPVRMLIPHKYFYKSAKWLRGLRIQEEDEPGFWEVRGYSNTADPWTEDRYVYSRPVEALKEALFSGRKAEYKK